MKQLYIIKVDIAWVNGANVAGQKTVKLTPNEAAYDLALGRITLGETQEDQSSIVTPEKALVTAPDKTPEIVPAKALARKK